jgi:hypothetical protein
LAGTVEANVETFVSCERNGAALALELGVVLAVAVLGVLDAGVEATVELLLLEPPHPASASAAATARATNGGFGTGLSPV